MWSLVLCFINKISTYQPITMFNILHARLGVWWLPLVISHGFEIGNLSIEVMNLVEILLLESESILSCMILSPPIYRGEIWHPEMLIDISKVNTVRLPFTAWYKVKEPRAMLRGRAGPWHQNADIKERTKVWVLAMDRPGKQGKLLKKE